MIGEPLSFPRERERLLRLTAEDLRKNYRLKTFQLRRTGEEIVLAEGEREELFRLLERIGENVDAALGGR